MGYKIFWNAKSTVHFFFVGTYQYLSHLGYPFLPRLLRNHFLQTKLKLWVFSTIIFIIQNNFKFNIKGPLSRGSCFVSEFQSATTTSKKINTALYSSCTDILYSFVIVLYFALTPSKDITSWLECFDGRFSAMKLWCLLAMCLFLWCSLCSYEPRMAHYFDWEHLPMKNKICPHLAFKFLTQ